MRMIRITAISITLAMVGGCASAPPMKTVDYVDLSRFMGDWYVVASIPTYFEKGAHNAVESYRLNENGTIETTFTFRAGDFDGRKRTFHATGHVLDEESNAVWGMQFIWPIKADYRVIWLDDDYSKTIIGRAKRDYVWIMAREPSIETDLYHEMAAFIAERGYDQSKLQQVPHNWPAVGEQGR